MFCHKCGKQLPDGSQFCSGCGVTLAPTNLQPNIAAPPPSNPKSKMGCRGIIVSAVVGFVILIFILMAIGSKSTQEYKPTPSVPQTGSSTQNAANDLMLAKSADEQALALGLVAGEGCHGRRAFYMGISPTDHSAYWSVRCSNGRSYEVQIAADSTGSTRILDCAVVKALNMNCFKKIPGSRVDYAPL